MQIIRFVQSTAVGKPCSVVFDFFSGLDVCPRCLYGKSCIRSARGANPKSAEEACVIAAETLGRRTKDIPFALLYLVDDNKARAYFAAGSSIKTDDRKLSRTIVFEEKETKEAWPFAAAILTEEIQVVSDF